MTDAFQHELDCRFTFDFSKVYWNSRLHTEHERLVRMFKPEDVVVDVFAGVGPFAIPAGRKGCAVLANDLNPVSHTYLEKNVHDNRVGFCFSVYRITEGSPRLKVTNLVQTSCEDGRNFIKTIAKRVYDSPLPPFTGPPSSRTQHDKEKRRARASQNGENLLPKPDMQSRRRIDHFVMNLPDTAISFLDTFRGILAVDEHYDLASIYEIMPIVHCHCFTRELDPQKAEADIRQVLFLP